MLIPEKFLAEKKNHVFFSKVNTYVFWPNAIINSKFFETWWQNFKNFFVLTLMLTNFVHNDPNANTPKILG